MIIGFNARILQSPTLAGWNRYTANLLSELSRAGIRLVLYSDQPVHSSHLDRLAAGSYSVQVAAPMPYLQWEQHWLPGRARRDRIDVLHSPFHFGIPYWPPCPTVVTLHDAIMKLFYGYREFTSSRVRVLMNDLSHWVARTRAHHILTVSEHAKRDLVTAFRFDPKRISVTHLAADRLFHEAVPETERRQVAAQFGLDLPYFLYAGSFEERKNVQFLVKAFAEARLPYVDLVLAGGTDGEKERIRLAAAELGISAHVKLPGWVTSQHQLRALYAGAQAFAYPSKYEGFGLQVCEAMAVGCPVLAARAASLPEILEDGGEIFELDDARTLGALLRRVALDPSYRERLQQSALARSSRFDWSRTALGTIAVYERVLGSGRRYAHSLNLNSGAILGSDAAAPLPSEARLIS